MPEIILCKHCREPIDKEADQYVIIRKGSDRLPESLAISRVNKSVLRDSRSRNGSALIGGQVDHRVEHVIVNLRPY